MGGADNNKMVPIHFRSWVIQIKSDEKLGKLTTVIPVRSWSWYWCLTLTTKWLWLHRQFLEMGHGVETKCPTLHQTYHPNVLHNMEKLGDEVATGGTYDPPYAEWGSWSSVPSPHLGLLNLKFLRFKRILWRKIMPAVSKASHSPCVRANQSFLRLLKGNTSKPS